MVIWRGLANRADGPGDLRFEVGDEVLAGVVNSFAHDDVRDDPLGGGVIMCAEHGGLGDAVMADEGGFDLRGGMRWPETFMTSSTGPRTCRAPSWSNLAPSPARYQPCSWTRDQ
jgi:hypothetical protein